MTESQRRASGPIYLYFLLFPRFLGLRFCESRNFFNSPSTKSKIFAACDIQVTRHWSSDQSWHPSAAGKRSNQLQISISKREKCSPQRRLLARDQPDSLHQPGASAALVTPMWLHYAPLPWPTQLLMVVAFRFRSLTPGQVLLRKGSKAPCLDHITRKQKHCLSL